ncbi:hypothetical protein GDO78_003971 [Eleutherodactylus coqui]|uniref:Uncharacterized protein n=1 Tax=Eleutherodactylus coqui TaxID=57060 RepID=A0A8J6EUH1_ELECQ|nr:hypothetical protein GDO78_003971 [Eleutherodactylus coqui]
MRLDPRTIRRLPSAMPNTRALSLIVLSAVAIFKSTSHKQKGNCSSQPAYALCGFRPLYEWMWPTCTLLMSCPDPLQEVSRQ